MATGSSVGGREGRRESMSKGRRGRGDGEGEKKGMGSKKK
jgi:hypothetical protein